MANNFGLFFTRDGLVLRLPVNPAKLPQEKSGDNQSYNVLGIGPITVPRIPKPKEVKISSFFPGRPAPYVLTAGDFREPEFYISFFQRAMDDKVPILYTPVRYYEDGAPYMTGDTGFQVLVSDFSFEERGSSTWAVPPRPTAPGTMTATARSPTARAAAAGSPWAASSLQTPPAPGPCW